MLLYIQNGGIKQRGLLAILEVFVLSNEQSQYVDTQTNQPTDQILNQA